MKEEFPSHVHISRGCWEEVAIHLADRYSGLAILSDQRVSSLYGRQLDTAGLPTLTLIVPEADAGKTLDVAGDCWRKMHQFGMDRHSLLIAMGGGAITDLGGFLASCYLRGIDAIYLPTTLLGMVDAAVGGKTGINLESGKNLVGTFSEPKQIFIDPDCLQSLGKRDFRSGLAEVIKYGIILQPSLLAHLTEARNKVLNRDPETLNKIVRDSVETKWAVVQSDRREQGLRAILNFGHTFAHAIEAATHYNAFTHGEAVAIGMSCALHLGVKMGLTPQDLADQYNDILKNFELPTKLPPLDFAQLLQLMKGDKKVKRGELTFILVKGKGKVDQVSGIKESTVLDALRSKSNIDGGA